MREVQLRLLELEIERSNRYSTDLCQLPRKMEESSDYFGCGYLQSWSSWNPAKKQEFLDRHRYTLLLDIDLICHLTNRMPKD